jgi:hypothetical protein
MLRLRILALVAPLVLAALLGLPGCLSSPDGVAVDWPRVQVELQLAAQDIDDVALLLDDEETAATLEEVADILEGLAVAIEDQAPSVDWIETSGVALDLIAAALERLEPESQDDARAALVVARAVLRRVATYAESDD